MGKKYRHLIESIVADSNLRLAYYKASKGRRYTPAVLDFKEYAELNLQQLASDLSQGSYVPELPRSFYVYEPKSRLIQAPSFRDRVTQHAVCNVIFPIFERTFLPRSFACRVGKGTHAGVKALQSDLRRLSSENPIYFLKTDFSRYFPSIHRPTLHRMIRQKISCSATLRILESIIPPQDCGLPIGNLTSQLFANVYGSALDRYLQQHLGVKFWYRYMDDVVILHENPQFLHEIKQKIEEFSFQVLGLKFSKWSISPSTRGINFLGYRIWATHKLLRKQSVVRARRRIKILKAQSRTKELEHFLSSWLGHVSWADAQNLKTSLQKEFVYEYS